MARAKDLAGLAALGFLGYKLHQMGKGKDDAGKSADSSSYTRDTKKVEAKDEPFKATNASSYTGTTKNNASNIGFGGGTDSDKNLKLKSTSRSMPKAEAKAEAKADAEDKTTTTSSRTVPGGDAKRTEGSKPMPSLRAVESKVAARKDLMAAPSNQTSKSTDAMSNASRAAAAQMRRSKLSPVDQIPGQSRRAPEGGERIDSTELGRNVSNTMSALTPIGGGLGKIGAEMSTAGRAQKAYNAAQAERRAAEGMSPAEALAARKAAEQAARDAKTLNPNAWLAGPKGMAENFRKGGAVKKTASGGMTASRRADGIATRGKTKCKMY